MKQHNTENHETQDNNSSTQHTQPANDDLAATKDALLRLQAEFANFQRRTTEDMANARAAGKSDVLSSFIECFDDFELAIKHADNPTEFKKGMEMVFAKLISAGEKHGLARIDTTTQFNPREHEALLTEASDKPEQTIIEELQSGYKLGDKILRTAKVKVAKK